VKRAVVSALVCPQTHAPYELDPIRVADDEIVEAFLISRDRRDVRPLLAGIAVLPVDLRAHLRSQGTVYLRTPAHDPRMVRFVHGRAGFGYDAVRFDDVVSHYRDLAAEPPDGYDTSRHPDDVALAVLLDAQYADREGPMSALVIGCGVGRDTFVVARHTRGFVVGVDRSAARVRRARNIAVTRENFFLPGKDVGVKEILLDLSSLVREPADFAVVDPDRLPFADDTMDLVVLHAGDGLGAWEDCDAVLAEAQRVCAPGAVLVRRNDTEASSQQPVFTLEAP